MLFGLATPFAFMARADGTGTVTMSTNLADGSYEIQKLDGTIMGFGSGVNPTIHVLPASEDPGTGYKILFGDVAGFITPATIYFNLINGDELYYEGVYVPEGGPTGTVTVSTNLADGAYTIYPIAGNNPMGSGSGMTPVQFILPASEDPGTGYRIEFDDVAGFDTPNTIFFNLITGEERVFEGTYTPEGAPTGTVNIYTNIANGSYTIYPAVGMDVMGTGGGMTLAQFVLPASPDPGTGYRIEFDSVAGFNDPAPNPFYFNLIENTDVTYGPNEPLPYLTGLYTPIGGLDQEIVYVRTSHPQGSYRIYPIADNMPIASGSGDTYTAFSLDASPNPGTGYRIEFDDVAGLITPANIEFSLILDDPLNPRYFTGVYSMNPNTGSIVVDVTDQNNQPINDGDWELKICTTDDPASCTDPAIGSGGPGAIFPDLAVGKYRIFAYDVPAYPGGYQILSLNPYDLTAGDTHTFLIRYLDQANIGTVQINVTDDAGNPITDGEWSLDGAVGGVGVATGTATSTELVAPDDYTLNATIPAGSVYTGVTVTPSGAQTLPAGGNITFDVVYERPATDGTVIINVTDDGGNPINDGEWSLDGAVGGIGVAAGTASDTVIVAADDYTLNAVIPAGSIYVSVTVTPSGAQTLPALGTITFDVVYERPANTGTVNIIVEDDAGNPINDGDWSLDGAVGGAGVATGTASDSVTVDADDYTVSAVIPAGSPYINVTVNPAGAQTLVAGGSIDFTVTYERAPTDGTVIINVTDDGGNPINDGEWSLDGAVGGIGVAAGTASDTVIVAADDYTLNAVIPAGSIYVSVTVTPSGAQTLPALGTITFDVVYERPTGDPDLTITKNANTAFAAPGDTITYTLTYGNDGALATGNATGVTITDDYDEALLTNIVLGDPVNCSDNGAEIICNAGDLTLGTSGLTFTYTADVVMGTPNGTLITNTAVIDANEPDADMANNTASATVTVQAAEVTITKVASPDTLSDGQIAHYVITLTRTNSNVPGSLTFTVTDSVTNNNTLNGNNGGSLTVFGNGTCSAPACSAQQIYSGPIDVVLNVVGDQAVITYDMRASNAGISVGQGSAVVNTVTAVESGGMLPDLVISEGISILGPTSGGGGDTDGGGGGGAGGYTVKTGDMELNIQKLVSLDGTNFRDVSAIAIPENRNTRLYNKVLITNLGEVSATNIKFDHFFDEGKSDITADSVQDLVGAHFDNTGKLLVVDKVKVGETYEFRYSVLLHESGRNTNPATDGLELTSFGSNLPPMQDGLDYLGIGGQTNTYIYAGQVPEGVDEEGPGIPVSSVLGIDVYADKTEAAVGDVINFTVTLENLTDIDLTNLFIAHSYDPNAFEVASSVGGKDNGRELHWQRALLRPGETLTLHFSLRVKTTAPVGEIIRLLTRALVSEFENIAPAETFISLIGAAGVDPGQPFDLAATGPMGIMALLMILSALGYFSNKSLRNHLYLRKKRLALQPL